eukprot:gene3280-biopygen1499
MINSENNIENDVNGSGSTGEAVASGRGGGATQASLGRYHATAESTVGSRTRNQWTREDNRTVMECYVASEPNKRGYRKRMVNIWRSRNLAQVSEQRLLDQVRQIRLKGWITELEMEEIKRQKTIEGNRGDDESQGESVESDANNRREEIQIEYDDNVQQNNETGAAENDARNFDDEEFSDEEVAIAERLFEVLHQPERTKLPALRGLNKSSVKIEVEKMNNLLGKIRSENITATNDLLYAASVVTTERLGVKITRKKRQGEPMWKRRLQKQVKYLRKDLSRVEELRKGKTIKTRFQEQLQRKYWLKEKGLITDVFILRSTNVSGIIAITNINGDKLSPWKIPRTQSLRTNAIKANIDKTQRDSKCRMCNQKEETVSHIVSECPKLAQREYKRRHDCVAKALHWDVCRLYDIDCGNKWYEHQPDSGRTTNVKILWDVNIQTDNVIQARRPDIVVVNKKERKCYIIDVAVPGDVRIAEKEMEKIEKYDELKREVERLWKVKAKVIPIVLGALGTVTRNLSNYIKEIGVKTQMKLMQKSVLLGTARVLRKVLEI